MNRIDKKFNELKRKHKKAFIAFLTTGYPNIAVTERLVLEFEKNGADIIELGVPFSDPIADGPVIQASSYAALQAGVTLAGVLKLARRLRQRTQIPLAAMSYYNPILQYGPARFAKDAVQAGLDAVIVPDLPPEEEHDFVAAAARRDLEIILFISPTTSKERAKFICRRARGFIYFVSLTGVTGTRQKLPSELKSQLSVVKKLAGKTPVCAGFGVSTPAQVRFVSSSCDGVIVGSALVKKISQHLKDPRIAVTVGRFVRQLKGII
jgi:tryptophan synthase alpha chain